MRTINHPFLRAVNLWSFAIVYTLYTLYILHAINLYRSDLNCEITCSGEPNAQRNLCSSNFTTIYSIFGIVRRHEIRWRWRWAVRVQENILLLYKKKNFLFENSQRLRSTKVASSTNNVKHTISKPNAVTDVAFVATKWQRFRREMEITNAKVCLKFE